MIIFSKYSRYALVLVAMQLVGCASMQSLSNYARSGDTVTVSLGGTDSNALVPILKIEDVVIGY